MRTDTRHTRRAPSLRAEARSLFRDAILRAAEAEFAERGYQAARIQDIAKRARIGVGTVYNHFDQKTDIVHALLLERLPVILRELEPRDDDPRDWVGAFRARMRRLHGYVAANRSFYAVVCSLGLRKDAPDADERLKRFVEMYESMMREGVAAGAIAGDPVRLARFFMGGARNMILSVVHDENIDLQAEGALAVDLFLRAAAPTDSRGER